MTMTRPSADGVLTFPEGFSWGTATSAYQVEGAASADGRGLSVWDTFSRVPGKVSHGDTGEIACDSYHRYREDVALMSSLGLNAYRFSIAWPRVQPGGRGAMNEKGLDYYRALLDELAAHGIAAAVTLYHWDLPQELQDEGGWAVRSTAERFGDYAAAVAGALGDRVVRWITINEPQVVANHGYRTADHAPGISDPAAAAAATHHLLLGHGLATRALRDVAPGVPVGITYDLHPVRALGSRDRDQRPGDARRPDVVEQARLTRDAELNRLYMEPVLHGWYPGHARPEWLPSEALIMPGDLELIGQPVDFLGVNYYAPVYLRPGDPADLRRHERPVAGQMPGVVEYAPDWLERTDMDWLVEPDGLYDTLMSVAADAPGLKLYITENGCAAPDYVNPDGEVNDVERVSYLHGHLAATARAIRDGANVDGYYLWSLLDNFEWGWGYQKRFGIVYVDFGTQRRIPKSSARFYSGVVQANAVPGVAAESPG